MPRSSSPVVLGYFALSEAYYLKKNPSESFPVIESVLSEGFSSPGLTIGDKAVIIIRNIMEVTLAYMISTLCYLLRQ